MADRYDLYAVRRDSMLFRHGALCTQLAILRSFCPHQSRHRWQFLRSPSTRELPALFGDRPILLGPNHQDAHSRYRSRDILIKTGARIGLFIQSTTEKFQSEASRGPDLGGVLA